jgi:2-hydroxychromene-2-carboxylate isomerase
VIFAIFIRQCRFSFSSCLSHQQRHRVGTLANWLDKSVEVTPPFSGPRSERSKARWREGGQPMLSIQLHMQFFGKDRVMQLRQHQSG